MRKLIATSLLLQAFISSAAMADALGVFVGAGNWNHEASGTVYSSDAGSDVMNIESDLGFSDENETYVWAAFEHFIPLVPNIRVEMTPLNHTGTASGSFNFNGSPVTGATEVTLDSTDAILYYRILDNWVSFDLGLTLRNVDGDFTIGSETLTLSETVPMIYGAVQFDLPFTGLSVGGDINVTDYDGSSFQDVRLRVMYEMGVIGFEAGYRTTTLELDDVDNINTDLEFTGLMLGAFLHF